MSAASKAGCTNAAPAAERAARQGHRGYGGHHRRLQPGRHAHAAPDDVSIHILALKILYYRKLLVTIPFLQLYIEYIKNGIYGEVLELTLFSYGCKIDSVISVETV